MSTCCLGPHHCGDKDCVYPRTFQQQLVLNQEKRKATEGPGRNREQRRAAKRRRRP